MPKNTMKKIKSSIIALALLASPLAVKGENRYYEIQKGDNLTKISKKFYNGNPEYYDELALLNGIKDPNFIIAGNFLLIPQEKALKDIETMQDVKLGYTHIDLNNKEDLNTKYYAFKKGDSFNKVFKLIYDGMFDDYYILGINEYELRDALYLYNAIDNPYTLPIGYPMLLLEPESLIALTNLYKNENKILKRTR